MPVAGGPKLTTTGILLEVDAADKTSYPGTGTVWVNQITPGTYNGTLNNISFDSTDVKGALIFTGSNTYVDFGNLGPSLTSSFSFQVAFKPAATASGQPYTILSYASASATSSYTFKLDYTSSNQTVVLTTFSNTGSQNIVYSLSGSVTSGSWNIVHGTFGSTVAALYVNGLGQAYAPTTGSVVGYNTSNRLYAGLNYGSTVGYYTGSVANIMVNNADLDGTTVNKNYNALASRFNLPIRRPSITDADVFAFVEAAGLTNSTQIQAVNTLVLGLKTNNLWGKMKALYPLVGGSAYSHRFNIVNINTYPVTWFGGITHGANGVTGNGTNGYGDTGLIFSGSLVNTTTYYAFGAYLYRGVTAQSSILGTTTFYGASPSNIIGGDEMTFNVGGGKAGLSFSNSGSIIAYRNDANNQYLLNNTNLQSSTGNTFVGFVNANMLIGRNSSRYLAAADTISTAFFSEGLSATEAATMNTLMTTYNTTLGRNAF